MTSDAVPDERLVVCCNPLLAEDGLPVHSFRILLADLATLIYNVCHTILNPEAKIITTTRPTPIQDKTFRLLGIHPARTQ